MRGAVLILAGLIASPGLAVRAAPAVPPGAVVTQPDWQVKPNGDDLADQYPAVARFVGIAGRAVIHCGVAIDGAMQGCTVVEETPAGLGFGQAALAFSKTFRMKPMTVNGRPMDAGVINIPIAFVPPENEDEGASPAVEAAVAALAPGATPPNANVSAKSSELAREIAATTLGQSSVKAFKDLARAALINQFGGPKLTAAEKAALDAYVEALAATLDARVAATADGYAQFFSEQELTDIDRFFESASGRAWLDRSGRYAAKVSANLEASVQAEARKRFCGQFKCPASPSAAAK